jgi:SAM-dependent methyltransferase
MNESETMYAILAAAYVRGVALGARENGGRVASRDREIDGIPFSLPEDLLAKPLNELSDGETADILSAARGAGLKLYRFKNTHDLLPRIRRVMGFLKGVSFESLLDVGSGRGVFLWPFLNAFAWVDVLSVDLLEGRVELVDAVRRGGIENLHVMRGDLCALDVSDKSRDVVTLLEVLEHIPDTRAALRTALRVSRKYVVLSVPSKADDNPEHIHLFTKGTLTELFAAEGCENLRFDAAPGHIILFAKLD